MRRRVWMMLFALVLGAVPSWGAPDGEGTATLNTKQVVAGSNATLTVEFTVGPGGIPVGGGISLGLHHASRLGPDPVLRAQPGRLRESRRLDA